MVGQEIFTDTVRQFPVFYAMRPEQLDNDEQRAAFAAEYPELVERFNDCWKPAEEPEKMEVYQ